MIIDQLASGIIRLITVSFISARYGVLPILDMLINLHVFLKGHAEVLYHIYLEARRTIVKLRLMINNNTLLEGSGFVGKYKGRITKIEKSQFTSSVLTQGIKKQEQSYYENSNKYGGGNGSYTSDYNTEYFVNLHVTIYGSEPKDNRKVIIDIRQRILDLNGLKRISSEKMDKIIKDNVGRKVSFDIIDDQIVFDEGELIL